MHHEHLHGHDSGASPGILLLLAVCLTLVVLYVVGFAREAGRDRGWSVWRLASFLAGMAMVVASLAPPLASLGHRHLPVHMVQHLLLGMLGPIAIVLGTPMTLALRNLPVPAARSVVRALHTPVVRLLSHPGTALVLNIGGMGVLYLTPVYATMADSAVLHTLVHFHFLAAGTLYAWAILQLEPAGPVRVSAKARLAILFAGIAAHATIAKAMYAYGLPGGTPHSLAQIEQAAKLMYYGGDLSELILLIVLFVTWPRRGTLVATAAMSWLPDLPDLRPSLQRSRPQTLQARTHPTQMKDGIHVDEEIDRR